jgi:putative transposase
MVGPEHKRRAVSAVLKAGLCSMRRACRYLGLGRSSYFYQGVQREDYERQLVDRIRELSEEEPTYGYRFITELLRREGWRINRKKVQRIRRAEGLAAVQPRRKVRRAGESTAPEKRTAESPNDVWSWDFIFDTTEEGKTIKILSIVDEKSRFCIDLNVNRKMDRRVVLKALDEACERYGAPRYIRSDNGPEFVAKEVRQWVEERQIGTIYIEPGSPWQNGYVESFHSRFRNDCLNREWFINELDAKVTIADWREKYNQKRPHSGLGYRSPVEIFHNASGRAPNEEACQTTDTPSVPQRERVLRQTKEVSSFGNLPLVGGYSRKPRENSNQHPSD